MRRRRRQYCNIFFDSFLSMKINKNIRNKTQTTTTKKSHFILPLPLFTQYIPPGPSSFELVILVFSFSFIIIIIIMKVFLHYEDQEDSSLHKSLKITLPKSWKNGPVSNLLQQFVESYATGRRDLEFQKKNPLVDPSQLHLAQRRVVVAVTNTSSSDNTKTKTTTFLEAICSDARVVDELEDRADVYICHGPSQTLAERDEARAQEAAAQQAHLKNTVACTHFGCSKRFPKGGPYPPEGCVYHKLPPVFHETAKYWACCPNKRAYDWEDFQGIPGCCTGICSDVKDKDDHAKQFLGGTDLREQLGTAGDAPLKSIEDFNQAQSAGGATAAPILQRLQGVLQELGVEQELYQQVVDGIRHEQHAMDEPQILNHIAQELGLQFKKLLKSIAAEQLRIK